MISQHFNEEKCKQLAKIIEKYHKFHGNYKEAFFEFYYKDIICNKNTRLQISETTKLRVLDKFLGILNAEGRKGPFEYKVASLSRFKKVLDALQQESKQFPVTIHEFRKALEEEVTEKQVEESDAKAIHKMLKSFPGVGQKKAGLFIHELTYNLGLVRANEWSDLKEVPAPIDIRIKTMANAIFTGNTDPKDSNGKEYYGEGKLKELAKKLINNYYSTSFGFHRFFAFDDLWFWGHFYPCKEIETRKGKKIEACKLNKSMLEIDFFWEMNPHKLPKECPFKKICKLYQKKQGVQK